MALKPLNSVGGFSVGEIPSNVILSNADFTSNNLTVQKVANLGPVGNVIITGGSANQYLQTDGAGNLTWTTADTSRILNGTSNVSIPTLNGNVNTSVGGNANVFVVTGVGANVSGTLDVTGNLSVANANLGNLAEANFVNVSTNVNVTGTMQAGNVRTDNLLYANGQPWDLQEAAGSNTQLQYNDGNGNFGASANLTFDYATNVLKVDGNANVTGTTKTYEEQLTSLSSTQVVYGNGSSFLVGSANFTFNDGTNTLSVTNANISDTLNGNVGNFSGNVTALNANLGNLATANVVNVSSNLNVTNTAAVGNLRTDNLLYANGQPWDLQEAAGSNTQIQFNDGLNNFGASANFTFDTATNTMTVNGNANVTNTVLTPNVNSGAGNLTLTSNGYNTVYDTSGNVTFPAGGTVTVGTLVGNVQANITITAANTQVLFSDAGLVAGTAGFTFDKTSNLFSTPGNLDVADAINVTNPSYVNNVYIENGNISGGANSLQMYSTDYVQLNYNNDVVVYAQNDGVWLETVGGGNVHLGTDGNVSMSGNLSVTGNIANANNITATNSIAAGGDISANAGNVYATNFQTTGSGGNITGANVVSANTFSGNLQATSADVTGNTVTSNLTVNLELSGNTANFTGNVTLSGPNVIVNNNIDGNTANFSGNISSLNANLGNLVDANYIRTQELYNGTSNIRIASSGNVTISATATSNVLTVSNAGANVVGYVSANGNGTFGALYSNTLTAQGGDLTLYSEQAGNTNVQLRAYGNGTVDVANVRITSLAEPNASTDAATKAYVDAAVTGLHVHAACYAATTDTLANASGGTTTYNAPGPGQVGAYISTTGTFNLIDGANVQTVGTRVLVKNEANAAWNGIYTYANTTALVRATDFDTSADAAGGDFTFVQSGSTQADTGWVQTTDNPTLGTSNIVFTQFSGAGTYQAGAGLTLTGTVFSVNVDNVTTEINAGNVVVKASAQLTTPNIGAATGTSLDLTGNVLAQNINSNALVTAANVEVTGNVLAGNISANANLLVNNATVNLELSGNTANFSGNVVVPNLTVNTTLSGNVGNFSGNISALNANLGNLATANYVNVAANLQTSNANVTGTLTVANANIASNLTVNNLTVNLELAGNTANFSGNVVLPNVTVNSAIAGNTANFSGNVVVNNLLANGVANVGNLNVQSNVTSSLTPNANLTLDLGGSTQRWATVYAGDVNATGNLTATGNLSANNFSANSFSANSKVDVGTTQIVYGNVTTTSIAANQTVATVSIVGVTGVEWLVKGYDSSGSKYSMATVTAVTDGTSADYATYGTVNLGSTTGTIAVNVVGSNLALQVTPSSTNSTVWVTQFRTI